MSSTVFNSNKFFGLSLYSNKIIPLNMSIESILISCFLNSSNTVSSSPIAHIARNLTIGIWKPWLFIFFDKIFKSSKSNQKDGVDLKFHSLLEYVKECREKEMSDEDIIDDLKKAKWKEETIDKVMKHK